MKIEAGPPFCCDPEGFSAGEPGLTMREGAEPLGPGGDACVWG